VHTLKFLIFSFKSDSMVTPGHPRYFRLKKITFASSPSRLICKESPFIAEQTSSNLPHLHHWAYIIPKTYKKVLANFLRPLTMREIVNSLVAAVACRFMQDRYAGWYIGSKRVTILVRNSPARAHNIYVKGTFMLTLDKKLFASLLLIINKGSSVPSSWQIH
jgi:hypothetical protein